AAPLPQAEQRPVEGLAQDVVAAPDRDPDALAEIAALEIGPAAEHAAIARVRAVEPEGERYAVAEQKVRLAAAQRRPCGIGIGIGFQLRLGEQRLEKGFVRGACRDGDLLAFERLGPDVLQRRVAAA